MLVKAICMDMIQLGWHISLQIFFLQIQETLQVEHHINVYNDSSNLLCSFYTFGLVNHVLILDTVLFSDKTSPNHVMKISIPGILVAPSPHKVSLAGIKVI